MHAKSCYFAAPFALLRVFELRTGAALAACPTRSHALPLVRLTQLDAGNIDAPVSHLAA